MYFYQQNEKTKAIEADINEKIKSFVSYIEKTPWLKKSTISFGLVGPCARGQGFYHNEDARSDFDFYLLSNELNLEKEKRAKKAFFEIFKNQKPSLQVESKRLQVKHDEDVSLHYISPTIFKRPDLMFFEYIESGKAFYGKKINKISIERIPKFEGFRNILFRSCVFFSLFDVNNGKLKLKENVAKERFFYGYSKVIFSIGEVFLLLERNYVADNFRRNEIIKESKHAKRLKNFIEEHEKMNKLRYSSHTFSLEKEFKRKDEYISYAFKVLEQGYDILISELFKGSINELKKTSARGIRKIWNRLFFMKRYFCMTKKLRIPKGEPFVELILMAYEFIRKANRDKGIRKEELENILIYWKIAPWVYFNKQDF